MGRLSCSWEQHFMVGDNPREDGLMNRNLRHAHIFGQVGDWCWDLMAGTKRQVALACVRWNTWARGSHAMAGWVVPVRLMNAAWKNVWLLMGRTQNRAQVMWFVRLHVFHPNSLIHAPIGHTLLFVPKLSVWRLSCAFLLLLPAFASVFRIARSLTHSLTEALKLKVTNVKFLSLSPSSL